MLTSTGGVKCWGSNTNGQLGDDSTTNRLFPVDVIGLGSGVLDVAAGYLSTCALLNSGQVKCWGLLEDIWTDEPENAPGLSGGFQAISMGEPRLRSG